MRYFSTMPEQRRMAVSRSGGPAHTDTTAYYTNFAEITFVGVDCSGF